MVEKIKENNFLEEINDYYDMKNKVGSIIIDHHYDDSEESGSKRLKKVLDLVFEQLKGYRKKHYLK